MKTKVCTKCEIPKKLSEFYKDKSKPDGHRPDCKDCITCYQYEHRINKSRYNKAYNILNPWKRILNNINYRITTDNKKVSPYYKEKGIKNYLVENDLKNLWYIDKAYLMMLPEIDRKDSSKNYTFENCQFIEMVLHRKKDNSKTILQYDLDGKFIREWYSIKEASKKLKICESGIIQVAKGRRNHSGYFKWKYKND